MNETRDLIIGIDLRNDSSQLCYYDRNADEPRSLPVKVGSSQYEVPTCLCRRVEQKDYCIGIGSRIFCKRKRWISRWKPLWRYHQSNGIL